MPALLPVGALLPFCPAARAISLALCLGVLLFCCIVVYWVRSVLRSGWRDTKRAFDAYVFCRPSVFVTLTICDFRRFSRMWAIFRMLGRFGLHHVDYPCLFFVGGTYKKIFTINKIILRTYSIPTCVRIFYWIFEGPGGQTASQGCPYVEVVANETDSLVFAAGAFANHLVPQASFLTFVQLAVFRYSYVCPAILLTSNVLFIILVCSF